MIENPVTLPYRTVGEWVVRSTRVYAEPFVDVWVDATFTAPSGATYAIPGFYDGAQTWRVRFNPNEVGRWSYAIRARPTDADLIQAGEFEVTSREARGFLRAVPDRAWGFAFEGGDPVFLLGDTTYNLFGAAHCDLDVAGFLRRRAEQGFDFFRVRCAVSPFHGPDAYSLWQTRRTWPWGGSEQAPRFDRFNLDYFHTMDAVVRQAAALGVGFEMIMEAWGFEYPFNDRAVFLPAWEELWLRYLLARYDAFPSVYIWTLMNEYEHYPGHGCREKYVADRWAMCTARWIKAVAPHGHVVAVHNGPKETPFARRFALDPGAVDAVMFQDWGSCGDDDGWLAAGIEERIDHAFQGWAGSAIFSEYGYERNPELPITFPAFKNTDAEHNRRGAWRGAFCGLGVANGFENTWGPVMDLAHDQEGVAYLRNVKAFFAEELASSDLRPAPELIVEAAGAWGHAPLALADSDRDLVAVYLPAGGDVTLTLDDPDAYPTRWWYDPRTGDRQDVDPAQTQADAEGHLTLASPGGTDDPGHPWDWALVVQRRDA